MMNIRKRTTTTEAGEPARRGRSVIVAAAFAIVALLAPIGVGGLASASAPPRRRAPTHDRAGPR
jgi:hypothetical protein